MNGLRLVIYSGMALALAAIASVAVAGVASGTVTKTKPGAPAVVVSKNLAAFGGSITTPRGPYSARPSRITFSTYPVGQGGLSAYVDHLTWVDWGQPVAYAKGIVHTRDWQQDGYVAQPGGMILDQLLSCNGRSYYTYAELFAPAGYAYNSENTAVGTSGRALTPCA